MSAPNAGSPSVARDEAVAMSVGEVMIRSPKTLPADASVADVRRLFERPSVRSALLVDGDRFAGVIDRGGFPVDAPEDAPALDYAQADVVTVTPATPMQEAIGLYDAQKEPRLVVLDDDGVTLRGLLCGNTSATGFCIRP
jgi:CBS domain-containing protein